MKKSTLTIMALLCVGAGNLYAQKSDLLFPQAPGMVSYTYRNSFDKDVPGTLDIVKANGVTDVEFSNLFKQTPEALRKMLDERGIKCSSYGVSYDDLLNKMDEVGKNAKILGAEYVRISSIPHTGAFTLENAQKTVADFNKFGKTLKDQYGLTFIYHNHGFEFVPFDGGTLYDYVVKNTDPKYVSFELDILWAYLPGQDPVKLLKEYGDRYKTMHLKDLRKGVPRGNLGSTPQENDVILGTGQIDLPAVLKAAAKAGIKHYYIEDESNSSIAQVPESIKYLHGLKK